ncbi:MAG: hypothetical protein JWM27_4826 [Gemmatimonadetes bacterium]|nr:hypothetical protein [Gemmatimonadota bacterium]
MSTADDGAVPERTVWLTYPGPGVTEARARIAERSAQWRRAGALKQLALWLLLPLVALVPPHFPWILIVLVLGGMRAWSRWNEHATLLSLHGPCPKCGTEQEFTETGRMKFPHKVTCQHCRWDLRVELTPPRGA